MPRTARTMFLVIVLCGGGAAAGEPAESRSMSARGEDPVPAASDAGVGASTAPTAWPVVTPPPQVPEEMELPVDQSTEPGMPDVPTAPALRRTPAEWEPQASVWLQWPQAREGRAVQNAFVSVVQVLVRYELVHLVAADETTKRRGEAALEALDESSISWHVLANDNSWMRDNGPRYVEVDGQLTLQNWAFDGWGGGFGVVPYARDNALPDRVAALLDLPLEQIDLVHERGDLEVNGLDTAIVSWSVLSQRNPELSREEIERMLMDALGVTSVVFIEGFDPEDGTRGHVDGMVRFVSEDTVIVAQDGSELVEQVTSQIAEQRPDLRILRMAAPNDAPYLNWLVGDGFVLSGSNGNASDDAAARKSLQQYFPGRDVHLVDIEALWNNGGGVHCVTNDVPEVPELKNTRSRTID